MKKAANFSEKGDMVAAIGFLQQAHQNGGMDAGNLLTVAGSLYGLAQRLLPSRDYKTCQNAHGLLERAHSICKVLVGSKNPAIAKAARQRSIQCQVALQSATRQMSQADPNTKGASASHAHTSRERVDPYAQRPGEESWTGHLRNFSQTRTAADSPCSPTAQSTAPKPSPQPKPTSTAERPKASSPHFGQASSSAASSFVKPSAPSDPRMKKWREAIRFANSGVRPQTLHGVG